MNTSEWDGPSGRTPGAAAPRLRRLHVGSHVWRVVGIEIGAVVVVRLLRLMTRLEGPVRAQPGEAREPVRRLRVVPDRDAGMATAEYAVATVAACAFAAVLLALLRSGQARALLFGIIRRALAVG